MFERAYQECNGSPTNKLLQDWGCKNPTAIDLRDLLERIGRRKEVQIIESWFTSSSAKKCDGGKEFTLWQDPPGLRGGAEGSSRRPRDMLKDCNSPYLPKPCPPGAKPPPPSKSSVNPPSMDNHNLNFNMPDKSTQGSKFVANKLMEDKHIPSLEKKYDNKVIPGQNQSMKPSIEFVNGSGKGATSKSMSSVQMNEVQTAGSGQEGKDNMGRPSIDTDLMERVKSHEGLSALSLNGGCDADTVMAIISTPTFTYKLINQATNGFSDQYKLGEGVFGEVYKGRLKNTQCAIKKLFSGSDDDQESQKHMKAELKALTWYRHVNIVPLYGYTMEELEIYLVYQYMPNGSLEDRLSCKAGTRPLTWQERLVILRGAACGLQYLHTLGNAPLIHGDIKSANILLDAHLEASISDLGMARHAAKGSTTGVLTHITKEQMGTKQYQSIAYLPPEAIRGSQMSIKGDTFSFGVVMLEACTGEQAYDEKREGRDAKCLERYVNEYLEEEQTQYSDLRDKKGGLCPDDIYDKLFLIALQCTQKKKKDRPDMVKVHSGLEDLEEQYCDIPSTACPTVESVMRDMGKMDIQQHDEAEEIKRKGEKSIPLSVSDPTENENMIMKREEFFNEYRYMHSNTDGVEDYGVEDDEYTMQFDPIFLCDEGQYCEPCPIENQESLEDDSTLTEESVQSFQDQQEQQASSFLLHHQKKVAYYEGVASEASRTMVGIQVTNATRQGRDISVENNNYGTGESVSPQENIVQNYPNGDCFEGEGQQEVSSYPEGRSQTDITSQQCLGDEEVKQRNDSMDHLFDSCRNTSPNSSQLWHHKPGEPSESECLTFV